MIRLKEASEEVERSFFERNAELFEQAAAGSGEIRHTFRIAGLVVRLRFAGPALVDQIIPAFEHLRVPDSADCDYEVCLWDSKSCGLRMDPPPCDRRNFTNRGNIWGFHSRRYRAAFHYGEFSVNTMDRESARAVYWVQDAAELPFWVNASPLRSILHWRLVDAGRQLVHAAVVGTDDGAVVIPGRGGSGKSTTALLCLRHRLRYVSDDYAVLQLDPEPRAYSLYSTAKLELDSIERFPELARYGGIKRSAGYEKGVLFLHPGFDEQIAESLPLSAIALPRITGQKDTSLGEADALTLEQAASFTTISHLPHTGQSTVEFMRRLTTEVPRVAIELGTNFDEIPGVVAECARRSPRFCAVARTGPDLDAANVDDLPLVSIVIPVHNGEDFVRDAIDSVLAQNYPRIELIVVNDASTDATESIVKSLPVDICYYDFPTNAGPAEARNRGVREAAGDLVAFLDADDLWPEGRLEHLVRLWIANGHPDMVQGAVQVMSLDAESGEYFEDGKPADAFPHYIGSALYRLDAFHRVGPFDRTMRFGEDSDWFLRAGEAGLAKLEIDDVVLLVRRHGKNMTWEKTQLELNAVTVVKGVLDRRRQRGEV
jgi:hypothetical protein